MTDFKPLRAASRMMSIHEAYPRVENQRDLLIIYLTSSPLLSQWERSKINEEVNRMSVWLADHKIKITA